LRMVTITEAGEAPLAVLEGVRRLGIMNKVCLTMKTRIWLVKDFWVEAPQLAVVMQP
jgi:hypothetical protein